MQKKRLIFNLDGTLLTKEEATTEMFFREYFKGDANSIVEEMPHNLDRYEKIFNRYTYEDLAQFLSMRIGVPISKRMIRDWSDAISMGKDKIEDDILETLPYLKKKGFSLVVLTNWFGECQIKRLEKAGILDFFDEVFPGDIVLKPHRDAYMMAKGDFQFDECAIIGNSLERDYIAPRALGMEGILYDKDDQQHHSVVKIKKIGELKDNRRIYGK